MADRESITEAAITESDTKRTRPWLRRVGVVVIFLLAGAIINVLVAWGCAAWSNQEEGLGFEQLTKPLSWPSSYLVDYGIALPDTAERHKLLDGTGVTIVSLSGGDPDAGWRATDPPDKVWVRLTIRRFGLPFRSLQWETHGANAGPRSQLVARELHNAAGLRTGIYITDPADGNLRALPLTALGKGFTLNTLLYALILFSPFVAWILLRRRTRCRRGLCAACGYDLRGANHEKCPECGKAIKVTAVS